MTKASNLSLVRAFSILLLSLFLFGCSTFSAGNFFSHYSAQNEEMHHELSSGDYNAALSSLDADGAGDILSNFEKGRLNLLAGNSSQSLFFFDKSDAALKKQQEKALISLSEGAESVGALAVNDNLTTYEPTDYETGFLHLYMALDYIEQNKLSDAMVEFRRANAVQEKAKKIREDTLDQEKETLSGQGITPNIASVLANYPGSSSALSSVQNGYLFFLSGLMYEANKDINDAYVDYRRALAVEPNNQVILDSVYRCAHKLGMKDDLALLNKRYKDRGRQQLGHDQSRIIVIRENGVVEAMRSWKQSLPIFDSRGRAVIYSLALPYYPSNSTEVSSIPLTINQQSIHFDDLVDVNQMAAYALKERIEFVSNILKEFQNNRLAA
ncbi:hypothetical protein OAP63_16870 [Vibrio sp.]|nr:hypothetical protein [Vibrio sp.]